MNSGKLLKNDSKEVRSPPRAAGDAPKERGELEGAR